MVSLFVCLFVLFCQCVQCSTVFGASRLFCCLLFIIIVVGHSLVCFFV